MATVTQYMTHARNFLKVGSSYASTEEVRLANTVNEIIVNFHRWHWNEAACTDVSISSSVQDYTIDSSDQNTILAIANAYLTDGSTPQGALAIWHDSVLPIGADTGRPIGVGLISGTQVRVWPSPDATYTLKWRKYKRATVFTANSESWDVPGALDGVVKAGMIWQLLSYQDDTRSTEWQKTFYDMLNNLKGREMVASGRTR